MIPIVIIRIMRDCANLKWWFEQLKICLRINNFASNMNIYRVVWNVVENLKMLLIKKHFRLNNSNLRSKYSSPKKFFNAASCSSHEFQMILRHFFVSLNTKYWFFFEKLEFYQKSFLPSLIVANGSPTYSSLRSRSWIIELNRLTSFRKWLFSFTNCWISCLVCSFSDILN